MKRRLCAMFCVVLLLSGIVSPGMVQASSTATSYGKIWSAPSTVKILQDDDAGTGDAALSYQMVRNEYESYQLFITASADITSFKLEASDLKNGTHKIDSDHVEVYVQKYVYFNDTTGEGYAPDILLPMDTAMQYGENTIARGKNGGLWITVYAPKETVAGLYTGNFQLTVESGGTEFAQQIPVSVEVYDYTLTDEVHAETLFSWRYDQTASGEQDGSSEMMTEYYEFFQDYRISLQSLPLETLTGEEYLEKVLEYYDRLSSYSILSRVGDVSGSLDNYPELIKEQILAIASGCTEERNLFDKAMIYFLDEPMIADAYGNGDASVRAEVIRRIDTIYGEDGILQECIDIISQNEALYGGLTSSRENWEESILDIPNIIPLHDGPIDWLINNQNTAEGKELLEKINCICPIYYNFSENKYNKMNTLFEKYDIELWWYGCFLSEEPNPTYFVGDTNLLSSRSVSWLQKKYNIVGNLYWDVAGYLCDSPYGYNTQLFEFPDRDGIGGLQAGDGNLVYPGAAYGVYGPLPSIRLMSIRDGMEEYELLLDVENTYKENSTSFGQGFSVDTAMASFYQALAESGIKMNADGKNGLNFQKLRTHLLQLVTQLKRGLGYAMGNITYSGNSYTGYYANFECYVQNGATISISGVQSSSSSGQKYTAKSNKMSGDTYVTITVTKGNEQVSYIQYLGTKSSKWSLRSDTSETNGDTTARTDEVLSSTNSRTNVPAVYNYDEGTELLFSFESYDEIAGTHLLLANQFGRTSINKDSAFIQEGSASWKVEPQGNYVAKDERPYFRFYCDDADSTLAKSDFSTYDKILLDIYNDSDEVVFVSWHFVMHTVLGGTNETEKTVIQLLPNQWTTVEYDLSGEEYSTYFCLDDVEYMQMSFLNGKTSKDDKVSALYLDNLRASLSEEGYENVGLQYNMTQGLKFEKASEAYLLSGTGAGLNKLELSRVAYTDTTVKPATSMGSYALKGDATGATWPAFSLNFDKTYPAGTVLTFWTYIEVAEDKVGDFTWKPESCISVNDRTPYNMMTNRSGFNRWIQVNAVLPTDAESIWTYFNFDYANTGVSFFAPDVSVNIYMDNFQIREYQEEIVFVDEDGTITIENPYNTDLFTYSVDTNAKAGDIFSFDIDFNMTDDVSIWVLGEQDWSTEWYARAYDDWQGTQHIQIEIPSDTQNLKIVFQYREDMRVYADYVATIQNIMVTKPGNYYEDISTYRTSTDGTYGSYPSMKGYVFAGWYQDEICTIPLSSDVLEGEAYAKFVDEKVLSVKLQFSEGATASSASTNMRMVTTVDSLFYRSVGFLIGVNGKNTTRTSNVVYETLVGYVDGQKQEYQPTVFSNSSQYFMAYTVTDIPNAAFASQFTITPIWKTLDGTVVQGLAKEFIVGEIIEDINSDTVRVAEDGTITMQNALSGSDELVYVCQKFVKTGDVISFNVDVTPRQDLTVWVFGCDYKQQGWTNEWKAQTIWNEYAEWPSDGSAASVSLTAKGNVDAFSIVVRYRDTTQNYKENVVTISNLTVARDIVEVAEDGTITMQNTLSGDNKPYYVCDKSVKAGDVISFNLDISPRQHIALFILGCDYSVEGWTKQWHAQTFNPEWNEWPSDGSPAQVTYTVPSNADAFTIVIEYRDAEQNFYENVVTISNLDVAGDIV